MANPHQQQITCFSALSLYYRFRIIRGFISVVIQCHFDRPREITPLAEKALFNLRQAGCLLTSQIALMSGVNAEVDTMTELFKRLHRLSVIPQYLFHPRPVKHATHWQEKMRSLLSQCCLSPR